MRWLKHLSDAHADEKMAMLRAEAGFEGYGFYWFILERIAKQVDGEDGKTSITYPIKFWASFAGVSVRVLKRLAETCAKLDLFSVEFSENVMTIDCPKILKYRDEWASRKRTNSGATREKLGPKDSDTETETEKKEEPPTEACSELLVPSTSKPSDSAPPSPVFVSIPLTKSQGQHPVTEADVSAYQESYPAVDVRQALRDMAEWCKANQTKRKTRRGILEFIRRWLSKEQDRGGSSRASPGARAAPMPVRDFEAERLEQSRRERAAWAAGEG